MGGGNWEDYFRELLKARGYDNPTIHYDPAYGWTVLYDEQSNGEFEARTTKGVRHKIMELPIKNPA